MRSIFHPAFPQSLIIPGTKAHYHGRGATQNKIRFTINHSGGGEMIFPTEAVTQLLKVAEGVENTEHR